MFASLSFWGFCVIVPVLAEERYFVRRLSVSVLFLVRPNHFFISQYLILATLSGCLNPHPVCHRSIPQCKTGTATDSAAGWSWRTSPQHKGSCSWPRCWRDSSSLLDSPLGWPHHHQGYQKWPPPPLGHSSCQKQHTKINTVELFSHQISSRTTTKMTTNKQKERTQLAGASSHLQARWSNSHH